MKKAIIGKKVGMTQIFDEAGKVIPVTVIEAGPCTVVQKMTKDKEGYEAVQFGYEAVAEKKLSKPEAGHLKKAGVGAVKHLKEFRLADSSKLEVGDTVKADIFAEGDKVDVTGTSKGKGYAGVIKRFGQGRTPTSHGGGPNLIAVRGAIPGPKGSIVYIKDTVKVQPVKKGEAAGISLNPQKASARVNPQKASARTK